MVWALCGTPVGTVWDSGAAALSVQLGAPTFNMRLHPRGCVPARCCQRSRACAPPRIKHAYLHRGVVAASVLAFVAVVVVVVVAVVVCSCGCVAAAVAEAVAVSVAAAMARTWPDAHGLAWRRPSTPCLSPGWGCGGLAVMPMSGLAAGRHRAVAIAAPGFSAHLCTKR